jgi:hypothetical protein
MHVHVEILAHASEPCQCQTLKIKWGQTRLFVESIPPSGKLRRKSSLIPLSFLFSAQLLDVEAQPAEQGPVQSAEWRIRVSDPPQCQNKSIF